jgi:hypothetical protein
MVEKAIYPSFENKINGIIPMSGAYKKCLVGHAVVVCVYNNTIQT